ncbi:hypothetical protein [Echinicola shivajiensis]|uniref:hypothetical protein n=1 Tax=Echinicola shivajiensis TaxID=1035916 RepID=UPI001BFC7817|nr:hypothetical protein [Echinicola shivajiensis]
MNENLSKLQEAIKKGIEDLGTLEVATFTGSEIDLNTAEENGEYNSNKLFETIRKGLPTATLVGYSRFEVEGDTINYLNSDLGAGKKYLTDGHNTLVEGAQRTRKDFFEFVLKTIKDI